MLTIWILTVIALGLLAWGAWPRRVGADRGRGADKSYGTARDEFDGSVRFATFNIHGGKGRDGRRDLSRVAADLKDIDIAALQEVHNTWRTGSQYGSLAAKLGRAVLYAPSRIRWFRRHRGNALLTIYEVGEWERLVLAVHPRQRFHFRNLTVVKMQLPQPVRILFTHLNRQGGSEAQLDQVMTEFLVHSPAVLMGDLNMNRRHPALRAYLEHDGVIDALGETLDDDDPDRIDWILCRGVTPLRGGVVDSGASDHPLYWCDVEIRDARGQIPRSDTESKE